jgi:cell division protein DivIC
MAKTLKKILLNKYFITIVAFTVWMIFFDNNSLKRQRQLNKQIGEINAMKAYYQEEISKNQQAIHDLQTDQETMEKYAREKYLMKRDSEDVYIVVRDTLQGL